jgi:glycosyltransferase involved in cell wall biosynthesis
VAICRIRRKKVVFWGHGSYGNERYLKKYFRRIFNKLPDAYLLYNERAKGLLEKEGINCKKLFLINNSLNYDVHVLIRNSINSNELNLLKKKLFSDNDQLPILVFIGRLTKEKRIDQLIESIDLLHKTGHKVNCLVIGTGEQTNFLKELVNNLGLGSFVCFYGPCYDERENGILLSLAECCVSPGNIGLTGIHSMSFGTPVITHNDQQNQMPEVSAIIENYTGELFIKNDINSLAQKIEELVFLKGKMHYSNNCIKIIDDFYNPYYQIKVFDSLIKYLTPSPNFL